jgi:predicted translin family RNA/ssDNA-binding protein
LSIPAKNTLLRAILADEAAVKMVAALAAPGKTESKKIALTSGKMTTEQIVNRIEELSKLRDEILQVMRQLNLTREAAPSKGDRLDYDGELESARRELDEARNEYQEVQGKIEKIQRQIDESKKKVAALTEISQTGFATDQLESESGDFRRALGRLPVKKLEAAQKALQSQYKDQAVLAVGNRKQDLYYVLVAALKDKSSQALQTLLLFDFTPIETPEYKSDDVKSEIQTEEAKAKVLFKELEGLKLQLDDLRRRAGQTLNRRLDEVVEALMLLRGILKLGEGTQASRIYAQLERVFPVETVNSLSRKGIVELESSS